MAKTTKSGAKLYNATRSLMSTNDQNIMPVGTDDNISLISSVMLNENYKPMLNSFIQTLINRIGLTIVRNKAFNNPLNVFKKGSIPLGTDIQDIYTNPAKREEYALTDAEMQKVLKITDPDTKAAYYRLNRRDKYPVTIAREVLANAFTSWDKFNDMVASITNSLYSGNYIDEYKLTKKLVTEAYLNNKVITKVIPKPTDKATGEDFLIELKNLYDLMQLPSTEYNAYSKFSGASGTITTWTDKDRIALIMRADVVNQVSVKTLAGVFNLSEAEIQGKLYKVDKFDDEGKILGIVCDEAFLQIYDNLFRFDETYNASVMAWNEFLHVWQTYAICPFANSICLCTEEPTVSVKVDSFYFIQDGASQAIDIVENASPKYEMYEATINPANANNYKFTIEGDNYPVNMEGAYGNGMTSSIVDNKLKVDYSNINWSDDNLHSNNQFTYEVTIKDEISGKSTTSRFTVIKQY